jgi:hypothetical protein
MNLVVVLRTMPTLATIQPSLRWGTQPDCRYCNADNVLAAEVVYGPHKEGEDYAEEDAGGEGKVDGPSAAAPGEVAG